jgi:protein required for attachment to host cells
MNRDVFKRSRDKKLAIGHAKRPPWVLVMNHEEAHVFSLGQNQPAKWLRSFANVKGRLRDQDLDADRAGRAKIPFGGGRYSKAPATTTREQVTIDFSKSLALKIHEAFAKNELEEFYLVGPSKMIGFFQKSLDKNLKNNLKRRFTKILKRHEIEAYLNQRLFAKVDKSQPPILKKLKGRRVVPVIL